MTGITYPACDDENVSPTPRHEARAARIAAQLGQIGFALPGTLTERHVRCGHPACRCHADPPVLHGPYNQWTRKVNGKTVTRLLSDDQLDDYQQWFDNHCPGGGGTGTGSTGGGQSPCSAGGSGGGSGSGSNSSPTVPVTITLDHAPPGAALDQAPVNVNITSQAARNVLAVPVNALVALAGGGFGVDVVTGSGAVRLAGVTTGLYSSTLVQVSGPGITAGMRVEVPSS